VKVDQKNGAPVTDLDALPAAVSAAADRAARTYAQPLDGARWTNVAVLSGSEHPVYQLRGTNGRGNAVEMEVTSAGRVIEVEEHGIPVGEVPAAVTEALNGKHPQFSPARVEAIYQAGHAQPVSYGFEGQDAAGQKVELYVSADGKAFLN
jgi:hypothetical protein